MMRTRPGSLTFLAVLNFIIAGFGLLGVLGAIVVLSLGSAAHPEQVQGMPHIPNWWFRMSLAVQALNVGLLIASGIGLLRLSPIFGRWGATAYALLAISMEVAGQFIMAGSAHQSGSSAMTLLGMALGLLYPVMLLVWVNVVVRDVWYPPVIPTASHSGSQGPAHPIVLTLAQSLRQSLRGVSGPAFIIGLLITGLLTCLTVHVLTTFAKEVVPGGAAAGGLIERGTAGLIGLVLGESGASIAGLESPSADGAEGATLSTRWAAYLIADHPAVISFTWLLLLLVLPLSVVFASSGLIARDAVSRGFRFLLTRISRRDLYLGRFLSAVLLVAVVIVVLVATCAVVTAMAMPELNHLAVLTWSSWAAVALILASLPYLALGMLFSTIISHPFAALTATQGVVIGLPILALSLASVWAPLKHLIHVLPLAVQFFLFHPSPVIMALAAIGCLIYTGFYLWLGNFAFARRDL